MISEIPKKIKRLALSVQIYLESTHGIDCIAMPAVSGKLDSLALKDTSVIIELGGPTGALVVLSFEHPLLARLLMLETEGLRIPRNEQSLYLRETAAEVSNIIVGRSLGDLFDGVKYDINNGARTFMSPPLVIQNVSSMPQPQGGGYTTVLLSTVFGSLDISLVWPRQLFDEFLNGINVEGKKE